LIEYYFYNCFYLLEEEKGWEALDSESFSDSLLFSGVNLTEWVSWVVVSKFLCGSRVFWSKLFAVSTKEGKVVSV